MGLFDSLFGKERVWQYAATLSINTPKYILEKHDDVVRSKSEPKILSKPNGYFEGKPYNYLEYGAKQLILLLRAGLIVYLILLLFLLKLEDLNKNLNLIKIRLIT